MGTGTGFLKSLFARIPDLPPSPEQYFSSLPVLETPRLTLRPMRMSDAGDIFEFARDEEVARFVLWTAHKTRADSRAYLRCIRRQYRLGMPGSWGIVLKETGRVVGTIGFMWFDEENRSAEVGYSLSRPLWNRGLMTEALTAVLESGFSTLHLHRIEAQHDANNPASGRVMEKCGMRQEGLLRDRVFNKGQYASTALWAILEGDPRPAPAK